MTEKLVTVALLELVHLARRERLVVERDELVRLRVRSPGCVSMESVSSVRSSPGSTVSTHVEEEVVVQDVFILAVVKTEPPASAGLRRSGPAWPVATSASFSAR